MNRTRENSFRIQIVINDTVQYHLFLTQQISFPAIARVFWQQIRKCQNIDNIYTSQEPELFKQMFCFMMDGTSRHLVYFDHLKKNVGYARAIETEMEEMASSHTIKRFFKGFSYVRIYLFRRLLHNLFIWRLKMVQPSVIELGIDTMVLDNDDELGKTATCRQSFVSSKKKDIWEYTEFGSKRGSWKKLRRALYCRLLNKDKQLYLPGTRPDTVIITNLGIGGRIDELLIQTENGHYLSCDAILGCYHERGSDELANRALKNFGHEQLPLKQFIPNSAWYYTMLVGHFLQF